MEANIEKILPTEAYIEVTLTPGSYVTVFYSVEGRDTTSGYKSIYYIDKEQYDNAKIGEKVRVSFRQTLAETFG